jgi:hypothetical protein
MTEGCEKFLCLYEIFSAIPVCLVNQDMEMYRYGEYWIWIHPFIRYTLG